MNNKIEFDCIIPVAGRDCLIVKKNLDFIFRNLGPAKIYIITKPQFFIYFKHLKQRIENKIQLIDEDTLMGEISYSTILNYLQNVYPDMKSGGWYFQQFLKMGFSLSQYSAKYYLTWDADTIPVNRITFFDINGRPYFTLKDEYHEPYFITIKRLLDLDKAIDKSFIAENMIIDSQIMRNLISDIEQKQIPGDNWCEKIINSLPSNMTNSFSEFETYGTYVLNHYPKTYLYRTLKANRDAGLKYSRIVSLKKLKGLSKEADMISFEHQHNPKSLWGIISYIQKVILFCFNKILVSFSKNK